MRQWRWRILKNLRDKREVQALSRPSCGVFWTCSYAAGCEENARVFFFECWTFAEGRGLYECDRLRITVRFLKQETLRMAYIYYKNRIALILGFLFLFLFVIVIVFLYFYYLLTIHFIYNTIK